jgi:hypothetical protein
MYTEYSLFYEGLYMVSCLPPPVVGPHRSPLFSSSTFRLISLFNLLLIDTRGSTMHVELLLASGLCAVLLIVPLVRFVNKQDFSAAALVAWLWVINVVFFVDATFWARSTDIQLVQWCIFSVYSPILIDHS